MIDARKELDLLGDEKNAEFINKLTPGGFRFIGARVPEVRALAKRIANDDWHRYLDEWTETCQEDVMLRGLVIAYAKMGTDERLSLYEEFVPMIRNWAVCDSFCMTWKVKDADRSKVWDFIEPYMHTSDEFQMRFSTVMMISNFMTDGYVDRVISEMDAADNDGYYLKMAVAWAISVCFVKYPERTMIYLRGPNRLDDFTYNKSLQKIVESYRVDDATKDVIRGMKRK
jgi:3-methyladenine DNA glycosylase AlkD